MGADEEADLIERAVRLILRSRDAEARAVLASLPHADPIAVPAVGPVLTFELLEVTPQRPITNVQRARIYDRDAWRCRYCTRKLVVPPVLRLLRVILPDFKGVTAGHHMPTRDIEPAVNRVYPNVDHIHPVAFGGSNDDENLVAACTPHNESKGNRPGWLVRPTQRDDWHGLTESVSALADRAGDRTGDKSWFQALGIPI